jgi:hypothetical protein
VRIYSISLLAIALTLPACKPKESEIPASAPSKEAPNSSRAPAQTSAKTASTPEGYNPVFEAWKAQAVKEFPDLGVAGSRMNTLFVTRAKQLQTQGAADLQNPAWPYLLAVQVNKELLAHPDQQIKTAAESTPFQYVSSLFTSLRDTVRSKIMDGPHLPSFTLPEALGGGVPRKTTNLPETEDATEPVLGTTSVQTVKTAIGMKGNPKICGIISSAERSVGNPLELIIVLEKTITCKVDARQFLAGSSGNYEIENSGDSAVLVSKSGLKSQITKKWTVGQKVNVQGKLTQAPSGKIILKDCIILDGVL